MSIYAPVRDEMIRLLSVPRLSTFVAAAGGDTARAIALYRWNLEVSLALFSSIHYFEVALRNTMHEQLMKSYGSSGHAWYDTAGLLSPSSITRVRAAEASVRSSGHAVTVDRVVAELPLGFWGSLLTAAYNRSLWQNSLRHAFTNARRQVLFDQIDSIRKVRNRIAHHEPLVTHDLAAEYGRILDTAERISHRLAWWIDATSTLAASLATKP